MAEEDKGGSGVPLDAGAGPAGLPGPEAEATDLDNVAENAPIAADMDLEPNLLQIGYAPKGAKDDAPHLVLRITYRDPAQWPTWVSLYPGTKYRCCGRVFRNGCWSSPEWRDEAHDRSLPAKKTPPLAKWKEDPDQWPGGPLDLSPLDLDIEGIMRRHNTTYARSQAGRLRYSLLADCLPSLCCGFEIAHCTTHVVTLLNAGGLYEHTLFTMFSDLGGMKHLMVILSRSTTLPILIYTVALHMTLDNHTESKVWASSVFLGVFVNGLLAKAMEAFFSACENGGSAGTPWTDGLVALAAGIGFVFPLFHERHVFDEQSTDHRFCVSGVYDLLYLNAAFSCMLIGAAFINALAALVVTEHWVTPHNVYNQLRDLVHQDAIVLPREVGHALHHKQLAAVWPSIVGYVVFEILRRTQSWKDYILLAVAVGVTMVAALMVGGLLLAGDRSIIHQAKKDRNDDKRFLARVAQLDRGLLHYNLNVLFSVAGMVASLRLFEHYLQFPASIRLLSTTPGLFVGYMLCESLFVRLCPPPQIPAPDSDEHDRGRAIEVGDEMQVLPADHLDGDGGAVEKGGALIEAEPPRVGGLIAPKEPAIQVPVATQADAGVAPVATNYTIIVGGAILSVVLAVMSLFLERNACPDKHLEQGLLTGVVFLDVLLLTYAYHSVHKNRKPRQLGMFADGTGLRERLLSPDGEVVDYGGANEGVAYAGEHGL